ncbi:hypothetical protein [Pantoea sp. CCBC3-3-1]|uniref:hypothetical protein n=1 Tax=Pantoea sp. CCBC3-3-1 TaxID=2490851 RepID=UPI0011BE6106|nr:hypothetical protein [Pantoea sp. CCBC3-3-1]
MKKTLLAIVAIAISFAANAQTASQLVNGPQLEGHSSNSVNAAIMMTACKAGREGINGPALAKAIYSHYHYLNWSQASFDQLIDGGFQFADENPKSDCAQIALNLIDAG